MPSVLTVSQFIESIRGLLRETVAVVSVQGEVTGYRTRRDNLIYFELKDEHSRVLCFGLSHEVRAALEDGMEIRVTGSPSLFKGNGGFHIRVIEVELVGEGALRKAFENLKRKLEAEGLFRPERKRPLPSFPTAIGLITSPDAAAYTDVLRILKNRWPMVRVKFAGVPVQGTGAVRQIVQAFEHFSGTGDVEVVILTRGGGSLEDLQSFNDEAVARAIFGCHVPVIVGVGHERDITIADLVADARASTPSNAAERVVPDRVEVIHQLDQFSARISRGLAALYALEEHRLSELTQRLGSGIERQTVVIDQALQRFVSGTDSLSHHLRLLAEQLGHASTKLSQRLKFRLSVVAERFQTVASLLHSLSPLAILKRGYSITMKSDGTIVRSSSGLSIGQLIRTRFGTGQADSEITKLS
ncbi:MAG: exodeoxyribonuclease VII large subunit [Candidatus Kerfeldbacteria bacterium]|nr:exodeoxyribonuclease VII large subunit [Candidatus Kerfeldbacteria bacterium]